MKSRVLTSVLLSLSLVTSGMPMFAQNSGHRGQSGKNSTRSEQSSRRGNSNSSRPGGNSGNSSRPGGNSGNSSRPGGNSGNSSRPGSGNSGSSSRPNGNGGGQSHGRPGGNNGNHNGNNGNHGGPGYNPGHSQPRPGHNGGVSYWRPATPPGHGPLPHHPHYTGYRPRPSFGINVSFGGFNLFYSDGLYYNYYSPTQYVVTLPPLGLVVNSIFRPVYQWVNDGYYYISQGVVYRPIYTPSGRAFQVAGYMY